MSFDGDYVTEGEFQSSNEAWNRSNDMGSRWFFYPFHIRQPKINRGRLPCRATQAVRGSKVNMKTQTQHNQKAEREPVKYTLSDIGCYVDGARGIYSIDAITSFADSHGMEIDECEKDHEHAPTFEASRFAGCEFANEVESECDEYMNATHGVDGAYWGRNEQGDWGLWEVDDYSQHAMSYEDQLIKEATGQGRDCEQGEEDDGKGQYECAECGSTYHPSSECPNV